MTYFSLSDYNDYYVIPFVDIDGNEWKITIQSPNGDTPMDPIQLVGAANPIEWMGVGDEDQTNVVLGSTGTLRLVCTDATKNEFVQGALFPEAINERKVIVTRKTNNTDVLIWQGFIKPEQYTQDWDRPPYEIELPIISPIAATEFFTMPEYDSVVEKSTIADLLWYVFDLLGCDINNLITNKPVYEDFNGNTQTDENDRPYHWTQGVASCYFFYDFEGDGPKPKTLKDVLETICYPYGKVNDCRDYVTVMMAAGKWISGENYLYELDMTRTSINYHRFVLLNGNQSSIELDLEDLQIASTNNSATLVSKPKDVKFSSKIDTDDDILELNDDYYKAPLSVDVTSGNPSYRQYDAKYRSLYIFDNSLLNMSFAKNFTSTHNDTFCRVVDVDGNNNDGYTYNTLVPLGLYVRPEGNIAFELSLPVRTVQYLNKVKLSLRVFAYPPNGSDYGDASNPVHGKYEVQYYHSTLRATFYLHIIDVTDSNNPKYLDFSPGPNNISSWSWKPYDTSINLISAEKLQFKNNDCVALFNEPRYSGDKAPHKIKVFFYVGNNDTAAGTIPMFAQLKVEYARDNSFTTSELKRVFEEVNDSIIGNKLIPGGGGSGENIDVDFKTMCGRNYIVLNGSAYAPHNSFCDATTYIDTGNRKKLELSAVKFTTDFVARPFLVNDGSMVYFPVAFGMNPRNNTVNLRLISTNIGITQPTQS